MTESNKIKRGFVYLVNLNPIMSSKISIKLNHSTHFSRTKRKRD